jgi:hypothetical protein
MSIFLVSAIAAMLCQAEEKFPAEVSRWVPVIVPRDGTDAYWRFVAAASNSEYEWAVSVDRGQVVAKRGLPKRPAPSFPLGGEEVPILIRHLENSRMEHSVRVSDGWLVAYNAGEFGATVLWYSADGKKSRNVSDHHVNQFLTTTNGVFAATGLDHLGLASGGVVRFSDTDGKWAAKTIAELPEAAYALAQTERGKLLVITGDRLVRVATDGAIETLACGFGGGVTLPNSIAIGPRGTVYVGMRQFVGMFDPADPDGGMRLFAPAKGFPRPRK